MHFVHCTTEGNNGSNTLVLECPLKPAQTGNASTDQFGNSYTKSDVEEKPVIMHYRNKSIFFSWHKINILFLDYKMYF